MEAPLSDASASTIPSDEGLSAWKRFSTLDIRPKPKPPSYPPIASIPRTSPDRLSQPDVSPTPFPKAPALAPRFNHKLTPPSQQPATLLYLAYGSNLAAETFLGRRGIRPLSQVNVSAPSLRLVFDLPGFPYAEPCFANTAMRKIPGPPPKLPPPGVPDIPDVPDLPDPPHPHWPTHSGSYTSDWDKGLIGVAYEVTPEDYAKILATEGGGASYREILVPCFALPPSVTVPEKPPMPELPKPFIARTLYAPRIPDVPDKKPDTDERNNNDDNHSRGDGDRDDGDDGDTCKPPTWFRKLLLPVRRPDPEYAQPSARYLQLIIDGAREHDLPGDYQEYLSSLQPYTLTTRRQRIGRVLFGLFWVPAFLTLFLFTQMAARRKGSAPTWLVGIMSVMFNLVWMSYDAVAKPLFGDGERTMDESDGDEQKVRVKRPRRRSLWRQQEVCHDEEKRGLLGAMSD